MPNALQTATVIDVHAHVVLRETFGAAGALGGHDGDAPWFRVGDYRLDGVRYENSPFMDTELRLSRMNAAGIDAQVLSPNPLSFLHFIPASQARGFCQTHNGALAQLLTRHGDRPAGLAALPMQSIPDAIEELTRAVRSLALRGACIGTDLPRPLDDPGMDRF